MTCPACNGTGIVMETNERCTLCLSQCARCGKETKGELCDQCEEHMEFHTGLCVDCVPRDAKQDSQDWWRGYHSRDSQVDQLVMQITRMKGQLKESSHD